MKKLLPKFRKKNVDTSSRITNETVAEHRELHVALPRVVGAGGTAEEDDSSVYGERGEATCDHHATVYPPRRPSVADRR